MKEFLINYWASLLVLLTVVITIIMFLVRGKKDIAAKIIYSLVTEAEKIYGGGTGSVKFAYVVEKAYSYMPAILKLFITYDGLKKLIEKVLAEAKVKWAEEAGIENYIKQPEPFPADLIVDDSKTEE